MCNEFKLLFCINDAFKLLVNCCGVRGIKHSGRCCQRKTISVTHCISTSAHPDVSLTSSERTTIFISAHFQLLPFFSFSRHLEGAEAAPFHTCSLERSGHFPSIMLSLCFPEKKNSSAIKLHNGNGFVFTLRIYDQRYFEYCLRFKIQIRC